jgi:ATP synthase A chain
MTLGMAVVAFCFGIYWTFSEVGVWGFIAHNFGPKGGLKGIAKFIFGILFFFVGIIEMISILVRPVSLSLRLFGNVFAGETLLSSMTEEREKAGEARLGRYWGEDTKVLKLSGSRERIKRSSVLLGNWPTLSVFLRQTISK